MSSLTDVVVVTGLSGAGKSTALSTLADLGYYCVDNLPPPLVGDTVRVCRQGQVLPIALGLDVRVGSFLDQALAALQALQEHTVSVVVVFLDAADDVLVRRYSETRRPHPLLTSSARVIEHKRQLSRQALAVLDGVALERERLAAIRSRADLILDTSHLSVHELRREVITRFGSADAESTRLAVRLLSFGFKYGIPLDADLVFDVRFLDNPHFVAELRDQTGVEPTVADFVLNSPGCDEFLGMVEALLLFTLPRFEREGKSYLTIAVGCTGGKHRSVVIANALASRLDPNGDRGLGVVHRDVARDALLRQDAPRRSSKPSPAAARGRGEGV